MRAMRQLALTLALAATTAPLAAQETRFARDMRPGDRLEIENVNGEISVTQGTGRTAEIVVTKRVKEGNGDLVKAILEEGSGFVRVCTIYLNRDPDRTTCRGENSTNREGRRGDRLSVEMHYEVRVPTGARLEVDNVNGMVTIRGVDTPADIATVNGDIDFDGIGAHTLETVNGSIKARFTGRQLDGGLTIETVNGRIELTFPKGLNADIHGETVNGSVSSDFPITIEGKWRPKDFTGRIGNGGPRISIETVNGSVKLIES
jgi:DUF4097 and DUF4098 domain-containing protein YvlB